MINKKLLRKWITALRSRKYKQGTGALRQKGPTPKAVDRYCCLGIACSVINNKLWCDIESWDDNFFYIFPERKEDLVLSDSYVDKLGISKDEQGVLAEMNDSGKKFYEIANYLERKYL